MQWAQQFELLRTNLLGLGPRRLIALAVAAIGVLGAVSLIGYYASRPETEPLYVGLSQGDVSRIGMVLGDAGIPFDVNSDGTKIYVRRAQAPNARMLLAERGLPAGGTSGYEIFDKLGPLGLTSFMQDVARTRALEGELSRTIQTMKGVVSARVHIVVPSSNSLRRNQTPTSASVLVKLSGPAAPSGAAQIIRHLVAAAVPGLAAEHVSVMSTDGAVIAAAGDAESMGSQKMIDLEQVIARRAADNIRRTLTPYLGIDNFEVSAVARINIDKRQSQEQSWDPDSKAERSTRTIKEQSSAQNANNKAPVSAEQNVPTEQTASGGADQSRKNSDRKDQTVNFELSSKSQTTVSEGHKIESLQVSLVVNRKKLQNASDATAVERQIKEIEAIAAAATGINTARGDKISVTAVDFQDVAGQSDGKLTIFERMWQHLDTVIISITAIAALLILVWLGLLPSVRTIIARQADEQNQTAAITAAAGAETPQLMGPDGAPLEALPAGQPTPMAAITSRAKATQQRLVELVEQDEKMVAEILKQWMVKA